MPPEDKHGSWKKSNFEQTSNHGNVVYSTISDSYGLIAWRTALQCPLSSISAKLKTITASVV